MHDRKGDQFSELGLVPWHADPYEVLEELFFRWQQLCSV